jgi:hypothetical protein
MYNNGQDDGSLAFLQIEPDPNNKHFNCDTVEIAGVPDYKKAVEARIRDKYSENKELDLINSYNAAALGLDPDTDGEAVGKYTAFLQDVQEIKAQVAQDFEK